MKKEALDIFKKSDKIKIRTDKPGKNYKTDVDVYYRTLNNEDPKFYKKASESFGKKTKKPEK